MSEPVLPEVPAFAVVLGVGLDLVRVPDLAHQLAATGSVFRARAFTPRERREAARRARERGADDAPGGGEAPHLAARWAAKEAFVKAWSQALTATHGPVPPVIGPDEVVWSEIEMLSDRWGRPSLRLTGTVASAVETSLGRGSAASSRWPVSVTHDGDWAAAVVLHTRAGSAEAGDDASSHGPCRH